jgi:hypothetical protein
MELQTGKYAATRQSWSRTSIRVIYAEIKASKPKAEHNTLVKLLGERMREDDDALMAAADYVATNCEEAEIGYAKRRQQSTPEKRAEVAKQIENTAEAIKNQILLLNLEMPNGKRMRYCTGREVGQFGSAYQRIAKRVGATKLVGAVLDEAGVRKLMQ